MVPDRDQEETNTRQEKQLATLEGLLELSATDVTTTLRQATTLIAKALSADKVDVFFHDPTRETLVALGTSDTPMGKKQRTIGLDRLPLANGGSTVKVFLTGVPFLSYHLDQDPEELVGVKVGLGVKSTIATVFEVETLHRGVLQATSATSAFFSEEDLHFLEAIGRWMSMIIHRAELAERMKYEAVEQGKRLAADELLTIMAHDLRNYLVPLKGRIQRIEQRAQGEERTRDLHDLAAVNHTLGLLEHLIFDLLDVARLNRGIFFIRSQLINLVELVQNLVATFTTSETPIQLHMPTKLILSADPERIRQLLENVLANAIKYAPKQTPIVVQISIERRIDGPWCVLTITNQGPGMPPELLATVFHPFVAGTQTTRAGLGLYLAQRIAAAHHGTLTLVSPSGQGIQVTFAFPVEDEDLVVDE